MSEQSETIIVENLSKKFNLDFRPREGILFRLLSFRDSNRKRELQVLKDISFKAYPGDVIGIIGLNGSGKSTLLRILAGIYSSDEGVVKTNGNITYLTGSGYGLKNKLTMKENIFLIGSVMGLSQRDIKDKFEEIVEFSGLRDFVDTKVYTFSLGMMSRLNFSTVIHSLHHHNPDILLLDEVFETVGDLKFQLKAIEEMRKMIKGGATVLLVSHNLKIIKDHCNKVIFLDKGKIIKIGNTGEVIGDYLKFIGHT